MMIASAPDDKRAAVEATVRASVDYAASVRINKHIYLKFLLNTKSGYIYLLDEIIRVKNFLDADTC